MKNVIFLILPIFVLVYSEISSGQNNSNMSKAV
jgi:hypothetical protein